MENILANFLTTNSITINTQNGPSVNSYGADGYSGSDKDFVQIGFTYQIHDVPEPSTLAVFALGLMGLASRKFKKQA